MNSYPHSFPLKKDRFAVLIIQMELSNPVVQKQKQLLPVYRFIGSAVVALGLTFLLKEPSFTDSQLYVLFLLFFAIGLWITEAIPAFAVSLFILAYLVYTLGNPSLNSAPEKIDR